MQSDLRYNLRFKYLLDQESMIKCKYYRNFKIMLFKVQ